jgi:hypothetical protein
MSPHVTRHMRDADANPSIAGQRLQFRSANAQLISIGVPSINNSLARHLAIISRRVDARAREPAAAGRGKGRKERHPARCRRRTFAWPRRSCRTLSTASGDTPAWIAR